VSKKFVRLLSYAGFEGDADITGEINAVLAEIQEDAGVRVDHIYVKRSKDSDLGVITFVTILGRTVIVP
jgi:hypothetical protein